MREALSPGDLIGRLFWTLRRPSADVVFCHLRLIFALAVMSGLPSTSGLGTWTMARLVA